MTYLESLCGLENRWLFFFYVGVTVISFFSCSSSTLQNYKSIKWYSHLSREYFIKLRVVNTHINKHIYGIY